MRSLTAGELMSSPIDMIEAGSSLKVAAHELVEKTLTVCCYRKWNSSRRDFNLPILFPVLLKKKNRCVKPLQM